MYIRVVTMIKIAPVPLLNLGLRRMLALFFFMPSRKILMSCKCCTNMISIHC